jgi:hypothetical protein
VQNKSPPGSAACDAAYTQAPDPDHVNRLS